MTHESLDERIWSHHAAGPERHRELAAELMELSESVQPDDEVSRGFLLVQAGEQLALAGDDEDALSAYRTAVAAGDSVAPDVRCYLHAALLKLGRRQEAEQVNRDLRRSRPSDPNVFVFMGEQCEEAGLLDEANRWFTQAVLRFAADDTESRRSRLLIGARWRVRKAIGFPPDEFDELAVERAAIRSVLGDEDLDDGWDDDDDLDDDDLDDEDWDEDVAVARPASVARKAPCPCGSGRKYKHCCGRTTTLGEG